ncbi:hypothetical protein VL10_23700 [Leclercia adecarboxylata]|nr:hypothetical protein VL10_23700 [Leclercia adecarboxylata]KMN61780.1 hypothetical protein VK95_23220 [Leclercia sp. LK8]
MIDILFDIPELIVESREGGYWNLRANGYGGRFYPAGKGPDILSIALPLAEDSAAFTFLLWNNQLAEWEGGVTCALIRSDSRWWLAQQFIEAADNVKQRVYWQLRLADTLLMLSRQMRSVPPSVSKGWRL